MACKNEVFDYIIKKNDTKPDIIYTIKECDNIDLEEEGLIVTASMWANSNLKNKILADSTYLELKNNYNLESIQENNLILIKKYNFFEYLEVSSLDYNKVNINRAQAGSSSRVGEKGNEIKIIKFLELEATKDIQYNTKIELNGETSNVKSMQNLIYEWKENQTSSPGEFFIEFKISKILNGEILWTKKFPSEKEGISIKITNNNVEI